MDTSLGRPRGEWRTERASLRLWAPVPGVLVSEGEGTFDLELASRIVEAGDAVIAASGTLLGFHDWQKVTGYDPATRRRLTSWGFAIRDKVDRVHVLVGSKLVAMGVSVASIVLVGMLVAYDDRAEFESALATTVRERQRQRPKTIPP